MNLLSIKIDKLTCASTCTSWQSVQRSVMGAICVAKGPKFIQAVN